MRRALRGAGLGVGLMVVMAPTALPASGQEGAARAEQATDRTSIRFNFKGATFEQVIDFFSRATGLSVVWETPPPEGTLDYLSPEAYDLPEALRVLNIILQSKGVMLRVSEDMLYLQKLTEMQREDIPTFVGEVPSDIVPNQIITVVRPLEFALAKPLAEKLASMVAEYGSLAAMEQQNSLVITETAGQVRRLTMIINELDHDDPEGAIEIFPIRHARATVLMEPLKALLSVKEVKYVINQQGQQVKLEEDTLSGLNISADERTNTIIAKGLQARIDKLREAIDLLDVPTVTGGRTIRTVSLATLAPQQAAARLHELYARLPDEQKPSVIALNDLGKLTIVGSDTVIAEGVELLKEIDGGSVDGQESDRLITVLSLEHADPAGIIAALQGLLNGRQRAATKLVAGPDGRSIIVAGPRVDVASVQAIMPALDRPAPVDRSVRLLHLSVADPAAALAKARELFDRQVEPDDPTMSVQADLDTESRTLTLVGSRQALDRFAEALRLVESNMVVERETRQVKVVSAVPSALARSVAALARPLLEPRDGTTFNEPTLEPVDELDLLIITAMPEQFGVIESLVATLDKPGRGDFQFRVVPITVSDADGLLQRASDVYARLAHGAEADELPMPEVEFDPLTGNVLLTGRTQSVQVFEQALAEARHLLPPDRTGRMIELKNAKASDVIEPLGELLRATTTVGGPRTIPQPSIEVIDRTNSLYVVAEPAQHDVINRLVQQLDTFEPTDLPPLKLIQIRAADAVQLADLLRRRYSARPAQVRREQPVEITSDAATNTLIVTAHRDVFDEIKAFVDDVNRSGEATADRETMIFPLKLARAADLARALETLYPQPPMPVDRRGRPLPHLRKPKEVNVSADAGTNTLIIDAPAERRASFEALVEQLDRVELPPTAQLRTYHIERGDPAGIARTLGDLARQKVMSEQPADGSKAVEVMFQAEPLSRTLIVAGDEVTFQKTEEILQDLQAVPVERSLRLFDIAGADPQEIADRAQRLYAEQTAGIPDARPVEVEVDRETATLLVVAEDEAMFRFAAILNQLKETVLPPPDVRLLPLEYADAQEVAAFLRDLADSHLAMVGRRAGPVPTFEAIERTNSVLVAAQAEQHDIIRELVNSLDRIEPREMPPLRILQLRTADAQNLASALSRQYAQRPAEERAAKPVSLSADPNTNALMVAAHPDLLPEIQAIVSELNRTNRMDTAGREIRIFPLKVARAEELARTLDEMFPEPPTPVDRRGRPMPNLREPREVVVRADPQTNSIIVDAPIQRMTGFETLVEQLDRQKIVDETEVRTYPVIYADLDALARTLQQLSNDGSLTPAGRDRRVPVTIAAEPVSQTLVVSGPVEMFDRVEQVLGELDVRRTGPATTLRFFKLEHARAESLAEMMREILLTRMSEDVPDAGAQIESVLNVTADRKTNTLIISAPSSLMPVAEELVNQLDAGTASLADPIVRVRPLTFADPREVSSSLSSALPNMISKVTGEALNVKLIAAAGSNAIILVGMKADLDEVEQLIEPLDLRPATDAIDARTFTLEFADAGSIAPIVQKLLADQQSTDPRYILERIRRSRGQVDLTPTIRVEADVRTNSLIVSGPQQTVALAETLIEQLDQAGEDAERRYETYTPAHATASTLAETVKRVVQATRPTGRRSTLELLVEPQTGAVVVIGSAEETEHATTLLRQWDEQAIQAPRMDLGIVTVAHTDAQTIARAVSPMIADRSRWPEALQAIVRAGITVPQPTVTADVDRQRLLVSAPAELMPVARELISALDQPRAEGDSMDVRIFNLTQAAASDVGQAVQAAMEARMADRPDRQRVSVTTEASSNSLLVTATPDVLEEVADLVAELDSGVAVDQAQVRTVFLRHARADTVAPIVEQLLAGESLPVWIRYDAAARNRTLPDLGPDVRVVADARLNAVVIAAPPAVLNVAEQMVSQLDVDPTTMQGATTRSVRILVVENADVSELAENLQAMFDEPDQLEPPPTIRVDAGSNSLIVRATESQFRAIEEITLRIDQATMATSREMRLIPIDPAKGSAADLARTLQRLLDRSGGSKVQVITLEELLRQRQEREAPEPAAGSSSLAWPRSWLDQVASLVWAAIPQDAPETPEDVLADAGTEDADTGITIAVDEEANAIIVVGSPRAIERVAALAQQVQAQLPTAPGSIRYIALPESVPADAVARLVNQTMAQMTPPAGRRGDLRRRVSVVADPTANALLVTCNDADFRTVGDLIAALSQPAATDQVVVKIYPLSSITSERAAASVESLIAPEQAGRRRGRQAQRMRRLALTLIAEGQSVEAVFDPDRIRVRSDPRTNSLVVTAPAEGIAFVDQFIELIDQAPINIQTTLKLYPLEQARATELSRTLRSLFRSRFQSMRSRMGPTAIQPEFAADDRTNTLLVTGSPEQLAEVDALLVDLDAELGEALQPLRVIELEAASPNQVAGVLDRVVIGTDQARRAATMIVPDEQAGVMLVRASADVMAEIDEVLKEIDRDAASEFEIRTITLERADAAAVAQALQRFFDDRATIAGQGRGRRQRARQVSIIGDPASNTLLIAASDERFEEIERLVKQFDTPQAAGALAFRVFQLQHAKATEIEDTVQQLVQDLIWNQPGSFIFYWPPARNQRSSRRDEVAVRADARLNALIVTGQGDKFDLVEELIEVLDAPPPAGAERVVRLYPIARAPLDVVADVVRELFTDVSRARRWWEPPDPREVKVRMDERSKTLIVSGTAAEHEEIAALIASIDGQLEPSDQQIVVIPVEFSSARDLARTLNAFLRDRARATNAPPPATTISASDAANSLVVSATAEDLATIRDLLARLDQADVSGDRVVEVIVLQEADAEEVARIVKAHFTRRGGQGAIVTADARTNSLIINAPQEQYASARALIDELDGPAFSEQTIIRTFALEGARATDVVRLLTDTLQLDQEGRTSGITIKLDETEGPAVEVKAKIVADRRSNSIIVTATEESFPVIEALIAQVDQVPPVSPQEWRIIPLKHAMVFDVSYTLREFFRQRRGDEQPEVRIDYNERDNTLIVAATADQFGQIDRLLAEIDQPSARPRVTEFVPLEFAEAEKVREALGYFYGRYAPGAETPGALTVRIVANPATNSLVISAEPEEWEAIRALLAKLDSAEYDTSLQLHVIPLTYADARSVAQAINEAFQGRLERDERQRRQPRGQGRPGPGEQERRDAPAPTVLVEAEEWVRASAEPLTNSVIVSASRANLKKIEQIVGQLDVADYAKLPPPQLIVMQSGNPVQLAQTLRGLYESERGPRGGRRALRIVGDERSNTVIVRAEPEEFTQIKALAEALMQQAASDGLTVHVLQLTAAPASRVRAAIEEAFRAKAQQANQPLSIQVDAPGNSLVIACTPSLFMEIQSVVAQLDGMAPAAGQGIFIIELQNLAPDAAQSVIERIGLDKPQPEDSVRRLVTEPIRVSQLEGRNALIIVANPVDRETIVQLLQAIDAEPTLAEAHTRVVRLRRAEAGALARVFQDLLDPTRQQAQTALAEAVQEQVRRLSVRRDGVDEPELNLDLTKPIRVFAEPGINALVISSTAENVAALEELAGMFDELPLTDAVAVQIFPLENISAEQFARIIRDLFEQGRDLGRIPGTDVRAVPEGTVGEALLEAIALSVDERTNTVIVAGPEAAVAFVEVISQRLDRDIATGWVEPRILSLRYADATNLAESLEAILVQGLSNLPQSGPLQRQIARLRMARMDENGGQVLESDIFQPMTRLVIRPEPQLNALILVGTPINLELISELVRMLDVEAASPSAVVRIYPVEHASAERLARTITALFDQQVQSKAIRPEDRVVVQADDRTNALIVTTSPRSFAVLEELLTTLDAEIAPDLREIRRIELENASAGRLAGLIQQLMDARLERLREIQPETADLERATIVADSRTNTLVVAAGNESFEVIRRLAEEMDESTLTDISLVNVITLEKANVDRVAQIIDAIMERRYAELPAELRESQRPLVLTDPRTTSLLVAANPEDLHAIEELVRRLEAAPTNPAIGLHVLSLPAGTRPERLVDRLQRLMRERQQSLGPASTPSDRVSIEADLASNSLIVAASEENLEVIRGLLDVLVRGEAEAGDRSFEIISLMASRASDIVEALDDLYVREANRTRGEGTVRVQSNERLNAVVVSAPADDVAQVRDLVRQLDGTQPATVVEIKYIPLKSANALETVSLIETVLSGRGIGARRGSRIATVINYLREIAREQGAEEPSEPAGDEPVNFEVSAAIRESISLTPDVRTNTIIVSAPKQSMKLIEQMIADLDDSSVGAKNIRIFKLTNADASAMAEILVDLFNLRQGRNLLVLKPRDEGEEEPTLAPEAMAPPEGVPVGLSGTELTAVPDERQQLSITVDSRTNSLLVSGTPTYLDLVAQVVEELDSLEANEREVYVYQLRNAAAAEVARVLGAFVQEEQEKLISTIGIDQIGSAARLLEREITIVGDDKSNTVLVSASPRYLERVKEMILDLDVDPPQVLIQVLLAEVTLDSTEEWGFEGSLTADAGTAAIDASYSFTSALLSGMGVPNISVSTIDFNLLLRALQAQGRLHVLSNPSVMAANNEPARIQVGEEIGRPARTALSEGGVRTTDVEIVDTGVILEVTPAINPDGFVRMSIMPQITDLTNRTTQVSEDLAVPILTKRTATTTVTVRDGQTIVIGGLISDRFEHRLRKVPLLGDIPVVGAIFRTELEDTAKTELLIVLTPHVISSPADTSRVDLLTHDEIDRLSLSPDELLQLQQGRLEKREQDE